MKTARPSDRAFRRRQLQRLAIALGMTLKDGSPVVIDGEACPSITRIKDAMHFDAKRMSKSQFSDARDDYGATRPYFAAAYDGSDEVRTIMEEWSGVTDCDGEMSMVELLQIS